MHERNTDPNGKLIIPKDAITIREEPAIPMQIKPFSFFSRKPRRLFARPPTKDILHDQEKLHALTLEEFKSNAELKDIEILAIPFKYPKKKDSSEVYRVAIVKLNWPTLDSAAGGEAKAPEVTKVFKTGFMLAEDIIPHAFNYNYFKLSNKDPLFPEPPRSSAIQQGHAGNCQLLALLISMLNTTEGSEFIQRIMKQQSDGTTILKLFNPITRRFEYIQVENSFLATGQLSEVFHTQPWVHILEKAYAVLASKSGEKASLFPSFMSVYTGEYATHSMLVLTGTKANGFQITKAAKTFPHPFDELLEETHQLIKKLREEKDAEHLIENSLLGEIFGKNINTWIEVYKNNKPLFYYLSVKNGLSNKVYSEFSLKDKMRMEILTNTFITELKEKKDSSDTPIISEELIFLLDNYLKKTLRSLFPDYLGSGIYTQNQIQIFENITNALIMGKIATASTSKLFDDQKEESVGLISEHEYSIIRTQLKQDGRNQLPPLQIVTVRNPWGNMGRIYSYDDKHLQLTPRIDKEIAEFDLDLTDFTNYFSNYTIGEFSLIPRLIIDPKINEIKALTAQLETAFLQAGILMSDGGEIGIPELKQCSPTRIVEIQKFINQFEMKFGALENVAAKIAKNQAIFLKVNTEYDKLCTLFTVELKQAQELFQRIKKHNAEKPIDLKNILTDCLALLKSVNTLSTSVLQLNLIANQLKRTSSLFAKPSTEKPHSPDNEVSSSKPSTKLNH